MSQKRRRNSLFLKRSTSGLVKSAAVAGILLISFLCGPAMGADSVDPDADQILRSMSNYLGGLSAFSANADIDNEIIDLDGQKLQFSSSGEIVFQRPGNLRMNRQGAIAHMELIYDGKELTLFGRKLNVYFQLDRPGSTDLAIDTLRNEIGLAAPGADLFYDDPYAGLLDGVVSGHYLGTAFVNGVACHYLTFREARVDWQLWVRAEGDPLPMKYIITTKWVTGAPQYSVRFRDWNTAPTIDPGLFDFTAPEGAIKLETVQTDEMGELVIEGGE